MPHVDRCILSRPDTRMRGLANMQDGSEIDLLFLTIPEILLAIFVSALLIPRTRAARDRVRCPLRWRRGPRIFLGVRRPVGTGLSGPVFRQPWRAKRNAARLAAGVSDISKFADDLTSHVGGSKTRSLFLHTRTMPR
jgi:hypothetical protein